jgi:hypothetical protein
VISEKLENFLSGRCNLDQDPDRFAVLMRGELGAYERPWLLPELDQAIANHSLSPELAEYLTSLRFDSPGDVAEWLRGLRSSWYGDAPA